MEKSLLCAESLCSGDITADKDSAIWDDQRVLDDLLETEATYMPSMQYLKNGNLDPSTRKIVTQWMREVCEQEKCFEPVLPLAVNLFDRFLSKCSVPKNFLQLIAADCILIASKIRQSLPVPINKLCYFTDHSVTPCQFRNFETLIAAKLKWDLAAVTSFDFIDQILQRVKWCNSSNSRQEKIVRSHSVTLLHFCCTDVEFLEQKPSVLAAASVLSAMRGIGVPTDGERATCVCHAVRATTALVDGVAAAIERCVAVEMAHLNRASVAADAKLAELEDVAAIADAASVADPSATASSSDEDESMAKFDHRHHPKAAQKPETPVDVQNVEF